MAKPSAGETLMNFMESSQDSNPPAEYNVNISADEQIREVETSENIKTFNDFDISQLSDKYKMNHKFRGCFIILNHKHFEPHLNVEPRKGTDVDCERLENTAKMLGFQHVRSLHDLTVAKIFKLVRDISEADHSEHDCLAFAVLTHGRSDNYLYAKDGVYNLEQLTNPLLAKKCNTLAGKPKLFFIQACRGSNLMSGYRLTKVDNEDTVDSGAFEEDSQSVVIPNYADFLFAYSTLPGFFAWRNEAYGSCFIQALCRCFEKYGHMLELIQILTRVNRVVAHEFESNYKAKPEYHKKKQVPSIVSRLTHDVYFASKGFVKRLSRAKKAKLFAASQWDHPLYGSHRTPPEGKMKGLMKGLYPITRTREYLRQGIIFRDCVKVMTVNYGTYENEHLQNSHKGVMDMVLMNVPQMRYMNPDVQIEAIENVTPTPYITFYLEDGQFFHIDVDGKSQFEILSHVQKVIGKPKELLEQETAEETISPANFGSKFERKCICMVEGQVPCSASSDDTPGSAAALRGRKINLNPKKNPFGIVD